MTRVFACLLIAGGTLALMAPVLLYARHLWLAGRLAETVEPGFVVTHVFRDTWLFVAGGALALIAGGALAWHARRR